MVLISDKYLKVAVVGLPSRSNFTLAFAWHTVNHAAPLDLLLFSSVSAYTIFQELYVNDVSQGHTTGIRVVESNSPVLDVNSDGM
ncbi:hypothetical protein V5O48_006256 [Marasmius crinis-equi]|uniref:Uncharacterized protein n=1 Tax=Marasmius crinis-equi TaxID=585013 RepID=A0ABR3FKX5_9AGAR